MPPPDVPLKAGQRARLWDTTDVTNLLLDGYSCNFCSLSVSYFALGPKYLQRQLHEQQQRDEDRDATKEAQLSWRLSQARARTKAARQAEKVMTETNCAVDVPANRAFAAFGRALAKIGAFEQFMRIALAKHAIEKAQLSKIPLNQTKITARLMKSDFGTLAQQVCDKFKFDSELREAMKQVKGFRNHLAHEYWSAHFGSLRSERGIAIIVKECSLYERQFERVSEAIVSGTGVDIADYVAFVDETAKDESTLNEWEILLAASHEIFEATEATSGTR